jgi:RNA polymerase sigma-70 factor (ECF subfamily)
VGTFPRQRASDTLEANVKDDGQLIDEALEGDTAAFGRLVCKYQDRLYNTMVNVVRRREEAEDVVQDAFVQAFVKLSSFKRNSAFYTWLYRIAFNTAISRQRRRRVEMSVDQGREAAGEEPVDHGDAPEDRMLRQEQAGQVQQALSALSDDYRAVLVLREVEGCCYETIADILDLPIGTVRSRLHRSRLQLREELREVLESNSAP